MRAPWPAGCCTLALGWSTLLAADALQASTDRAGAGPFAWLQALQPMASVFATPSFDAVNGTVLTLGTSKSGSSFVGSLLDAHPKVVLPNHWGLLDHLDQPAPKLYTALYKLAALQAAIKPGGAKAVGSDFFYAKEDRHFVYEGYQNHVEGQWHGRVDGSPYLVGDKKGAAILDLSFDELTDKLRKLIQVTKVPLYIVHVTRNPFDAIAAQLVDKVFRHGLYEKMEFKDFKRREWEEEVEAGHRPPMPLNASRKLQRWIDSYVEKMGTVQSLVELLQKDPNSLGGPVKILNVDLNRLINNPKFWLRRLGADLGLVVSEEYLDACERIVWPSNHYSRLNLVWGEGHVCRTLEHIGKFGFLKHYATAAPKAARTTDGRCAVASASPALGRAPAAARSV
eukprot:CAMPEP_0179251014 /NCGR_PEP_ID=MMETSP0797-20121207/21470_1 /TAXON_ID=47934 /ORGANISM="Dinophysis acuminata, Strain DAEP01" /LENGTH=395 /DNA_ID=CAMNT_0020958779 /DNA_START=1 /DNA_END=1186 /DNA_ORIENTATION=-